MQMSNNKPSRQSSLPPHPGAPRGRGQDPPGHEGNTGKCTRRGGERALVPEGKWCCRNSGDTFEAPSEKSPQEDCIRQLSHRHRHRAFLRELTCQAQSVNPVVSLLPRATVIKPLLGTGMKTKRRSSSRTGKTWFPWAE